MDEFEIEVIGVKASRQTDGRLKRAVGKAGQVVRAFLMRPRLVVLTGVVTFALFVGTPHAGWDYECRHPMRSGQPCRSVVYCAYYGIQGRRIEVPDDGESCKPITFLPPQWGKLMGE